MDLTRRVWCHAVEEDSVNPLARLADRNGFSTVSMSVGLMAMVLVTGCACDRANESESTWSPADEVSSSAPAAGAYVLDPDHSFIYFAAQHMVVGTVRGRFNTMTGAVVAGSDPLLSRVDVVIDGASLDTQNDSRDTHLRSPDFFDVLAFPRIEYHGAGFRKVGQRWIVDGSLMIRGVVREVPLELVVKGIAPAQAGNPSRIAVHATAAVKRADFGMTRGLLDEIGVVSVRPDVWIEIDAEFLAQAQRSVSAKPDRQSKSIERN
jgi:polyisoprenoid-binding protein YceI